MKTLNEPKTFLESEVTKQLIKGWRIATRTDTSCQLIGDKKPEICLMLTTLADDKQNVEMRYLS